MKFNSTTKFILGVALLLLVIVILIANSLLNSTTHQQEENLPTSQPKIVKSKNYDPTRYEKFLKQEKTEQRRKQQRLPGDIRSTKEIILGHANSNAEFLFDDFSSFCTSGPGYIRCGTKALNETTSTKNEKNQLGCCSCAWTPIQKSCSGAFNGSNTPLMQRVREAHYVSSPTSPRIPTLRQTAQACPWFDGGRWNLPFNFLDLSFDEAAEASLKAGLSLRQQQSGMNNKFSREEIENEKKYRSNLGPLLVWKLGRKLRELRSQKVYLRARKNINNNNSSPEMEKMEEANAPPSDFYHSPGVLLFSGDSMIRQVFTRLIHAIRSRECKDENEMFRGGVFERYYHLSAGYVVTTSGDMLALEWEKGCERVAREPVASSFFTTQIGNQTFIRDNRVLLRICYIWDNKRDASYQEYGTDFAVTKISEKLKAQISAILFWPTMHHCNYAEGKCADANVSNAAVFTVIASATRNHVPRVIVASSIMRQWYPHYFSELIAERNAQLKAFFPFNMFSRVQKHLNADRIMNIWRRKRYRRDVKKKLAMILHNKTMWEEAMKIEREKEAQLYNNFLEDEPEEIERNSLYFAMSSGGAGNRFRFYDFANRHAHMMPRQCDHGHSMCMFFPLRVHFGVSAWSVNGMSGVCPNGGRCEDPWNFLYMYEMLALLNA
jgi:translation initiation factor 2 beta subunit (eIF-2beta)/eIF-5